MPPRLLSKWLSTPSHDCALRAVANCLGERRHTEQRREEACNHQRDWGHWRTGGHRRRPLRDIQRYDQKGAHSQSTEHSSPYCPKELSHQQVTSNPNRLPHNPQPNWTANLRDGQARLIDRPLAAVKSLIEVP